MCENLPYESVYFKEIMASLKTESVPVVSGALGLVNKKSLETSILRNLKDKPFVHSPYFMKNTS